MNKVFLIGRLTADPEQFTSKSGNSSPVKITLAVQDNNRRSETYFFPCVAWGNSANFISTYLRKGNLVAVDGKLTRREFTTKDGRRSSATEIVIEGINSLGGKAEGQSTGTGHTTGYKKAEATKSIDAVFPENVTTHGHDKNKVTADENDSSGEVQWFDINNKEK